MTLNQFEIPIKKKSEVEITYKYGVHFKMISIIPKQYFIIQIKVFFLLDKIRLDR